MTVTRSPVRSYARSLAPMMSSNASHTSTSLAKIVTLPVTLRPAMKLIPLFWESSFRTSRMSTPLRSSEIRWLAWPAAAAETGSSWARACPVHPSARPMITPMHAVRLFIAAPLSQRQLNFFALQIQNHAIVQHLVHHSPLDHDLPRRHEMGL